MSETIVNHPRVKAIMLKRCIVITDRFRRQMVVGRGSGKQCASARKITEISFSPPSTTSFQADAEQVDANTLKDLTPPPGLADGSEGRRLYKRAITELQTGTIEKRYMTSLYSKSNAFYICANFEPKS